MSYFNKQIAVFILAMSTGCVKAELVVESGFVRASLPGMASTAAYMTLKNTGDADLAITGITTSVAAKVSIHSTMNHDGMMHMIDMNSLTVAAHKTVVLESGGMHLMLENTAGMLAADSKVELVLQFANGGKQALRLPVLGVLADKR